MTRELDVTVGSNVAATPERVRAIMSEPRHERVVTRGRTRRRPMCRNRLGARVSIALVRAGNSA